jgi:hypothetical protein
MTNHKWTIIGIGIAAIIGFIALGFAAMSTSSPYTVSSWVPILFFILAVLIFLTLGVYLLFHTITDKFTKKPISHTTKASVEFKTKPANKDEGLPDILTAMHRRLVGLQKVKASHTKIGLKKFEAVMPTLADKMGTVKLKEWPKFEKEIKRRLRKAIPQPKYRRRFTFWEFMRWRERARLMALSVASQVQKELFQSKEWTFEDGVKISEWLDGYHWGVKELRDNDPHWKALFESISTHLKDEKLSDLINKHLDFSYVYNNVCLIFHYSENFSKTSFLSMLHETLIGSPISPEKAEIALSEILSKVDDRLKQLSRSKSMSGIKVHECLLEPARPFYLILIIKCTITVPATPINVASLKLFLGTSHSVELQFPTLPILINNSPESFVLKYEVYTSLIGSEIPAHISALAGGETFSSPTLEIPYGSPLLPREISQNPSLKATVHNVKMGDRLFEAGAQIIDLLV